jgi:hypothetical protein
MAERAKMPWVRDSLSRESAYDPRDRLASLDTGGPFVGVVKAAAENSVDSVA